MRLIACLDRAARAGMGALPRLAWGVSLSLVLGAIIHLSTVLRIPALSTNSAQARIAGTVPAHETTIYDPGAVKSDASPKDARLSIAFADPAVVMATCPFDVREDPVRVRAFAGDLTATMAFMTSDGRVFYGVSDRAAQRGVIDILLMTQAQLDDAVANDEDGELPRDIRLTTPTARGLVIFRVVVGHESQRKQATTLARRLTCAPDVGSDEN